MTLAAYAAADIALNRTVVAGQEAIEFAETQGGGAGLVAPEMELGRPEPQPTIVGAVRKNGHRERADSLCDGLVVPRGGATRADVYDDEALGSQRDEEPGRAGGGIGRKAGETRGQVAEIQRHHGDADPAQGEQLDDAVEGGGVARSGRGKRLANGRDLDGGRPEFTCGREAEFHGNTVAVFPPIACAEALQIDGPQAKRDPENPGATKL